MDMQYKFRINNFSFSICNLKVKISRVVELEGFFFFLFFARLIPISITIFKKLKATYKSLKMLVIKYNAKIFSKIHKKFLV